MIDYRFTVGVLGILAGIVLSAYDRLPSQIAAIAGTIGGLISLISGIFGSVIVQSVPKGIKSIWQNAHRLIAISSGILTLIALILVVILVPFVNAALFPSPKTETYPPFENMVINDPLNDNSNGYQWLVEVGEDNSGSCGFAGGKYHIIANANHSKSCPALATDFKDFAYQVKMTIVTGSSGGIFFRSDPFQGSYYFFHISSIGAYRFEVCSYKKGEWSCQNKKTGQSQDFHSGQSNLLTVVANGSNFDLYVNNQKLTANGAIIDTTYSGGQIGVFAGTKDTPTDAIFENVKVWTR